MANYSFGDQHQAPASSNRRAENPTAGESRGYGSSSDLRNPARRGGLPSADRRPDRGRRRDPAGSPGDDRNGHQTVHETEAVETTKRVTETVTATPTTTEDEDSGDTFGDGTWMVGEDIKAGTYRTKGDPDGCYWARLSGTSGEFTDLIANGNPTGPTTVTISATDVAFETRGCAAWRPVS